MQASLAVFAIGMGFPFENAYVPEGPVKKLPCVIATRTGSDVWFNPHSATILRNCR